VKSVDTSGMRTITLDFAPKQSEK